MNGMTRIRRFGRGFWAFPLGRFTVKEYAVYIGGSREAARHRILVAVRAGTLRVDGKVEGKRGRPEFYYTAMDKAAETRRALRRWRQQLMN
jgi:predicted ArsR family transcriptional regulator